MGKAKLLHLCIHGRHAVRDGAAAEILRQQVGAVVGAGHLGGVQRIHQGNFFPFPQGNMAGIRARQRVDILVGHGQLYVIPVSLRLFAGKTKGHYLGNGGRVQLLVHILLRQHKAGVCIHDAVCPGIGQRRAGCCRAGHQHSAYQKQHGAQCCGKFFHLVFSAYPFYADKTSFEVYHIFSPLKRDLHIPLSQQHRLQLLTPQSGVHGGGQQGKVGLQALGLG